MDYFRSVTQSVLGAPQPGQQPSGADTVERLIDRVQSSTLLEDRRDGCRALKSMSRKYRVLVGAHGMDTLIQVLEADRSDHEIVNYAIETLVHITSPETFQEEMEENGELSEASYSSVVGEQFTEIFTKRQENIELLINLLDEFDFKVRYPTVKLLTNLLKNRPKDLQETILVVPSGVSKLMDLLSDSREVVRNDALLLLTQLTKNNTNLQKIVAFENGYDHIFAIIKSEGYADGGVVVEDCLILMLNLLRNNPSNQTFFKEGSYIQRLTSFFILPMDNKEGWSAQKVTNIHYMLQLVRSLVAPQNPAQAVTSCQRVMNQCGLLQNLTALLMASGVPVDILTDTINTVSDMIRGNMPNQEFFASMMAPSTPPRPAIVVLLMSMVNDKQPFVLRCAVLYCFQCFLYRNQTGQAQIIQTLLPQTADEANSITAGQLLCSGLFSSDPVSNWFAAVALSHSLVDNLSQKENMLRVQLATSVGSQPVSLMQQCTSILQAGPKVLTRLGILMLLSTWLAHSPMAVQTFLAIPAAVPHLTTHVSANEHDELEIVCQGLCAFLLGMCIQFNDGSGTSFSTDSLRQLVTDRIGAEMFTDKLSNILRTEAYTKAVKSPQLAVKQPSDLVFDHQFCRLFKSLEVTCLRAVTPQLAGGSSAEVTPVEVTKYKDIIRDQDAEITQLRERLAGVQKEVEELKVGKEQMSAQVQQLHDENTVLRVQQGISRETEVTKEESEQNTTVTTTADTTAATTTAATTTTTDTAPATTDPATEQQQMEQLTLLQQQLAEMTHARDYYYYEMYKKDTELTAMQQQLQQLQQQQQQQSSEVQQQQQQQQQTCGQQQASTVTQQTNNHLDSQNAADFFDSLSNPEMENLRKQLEDLQLVLYNKDSEIQQLKEAAAQAPPHSEHNGTVERETEVSGEHLDEAAQARLQQECATLKQQVKDYEIHVKQLQTQLETAAAAAAAATAASVAVGTGSGNTAEARCKQLEEELDTIKREQEDLLVLVTDQDSKMSEYRRKLRTYGEDVTEDEDEEDEDGDFAITENYDDDLEDIQ
ncbi:general vesicular transport factor p115-like isoform X2 [Portunus trituberculatus]|uniref:general vesicular transport factor p115-like isoform X2 n=1 Tax=Portunus trituberculatus TaxID=210409 RepID=UPI001E1D1744|nr:general vesicular transport factor p115-like isoform X2 [Portunus trituberculatus]